MPERRHIEILFGAVPPRELLPNKANGQHWGKTAHLRGQLRADSALEAQAQVPVDVRPGCSDALDGEILIAWPLERAFVDLDNALAACKSLIDGMCDGLGVDDRAFVHFGIRQQMADVGDRRGWVRVTLTVNP